MDDQEVAAINGVNLALKDLDEEARFRVIQWAVNRYAPSARREHATGTTRDESEPSLLIDSSDEDAGQFTTFAELLDASGASTESDRILVAAYWLQTQESNLEWKTSQINKLLKDTGFAIKYIAAAIRPHVNKKPKLVVQLSQSSSPKGSGHKRYKLTTEGEKQVRALLSNEQAVE